MTWQQDAACAGMDTEFFYPGDDRANEALKVCALCTSRSFCLEDALQQEMEDGFAWGVRGGTNQSQRSQMLKLRRKAAAAVKA